MNNILQLLSSRLKNIAGRCIVTLLEASGHQVTLFNGETTSRLEHLQEFGFASVKPSTHKGEGICLFFGGNRANGALLVMEIPELKPSLNPGETAVFNSHDAFIKLLEGKLIEINGSNCNELIKIDELTAKLNAHIAEYDAHMHGGVTPGEGTTAAPTAPGTPFNKTDYANTKVVHGE